MKKHSNSPLYEQIRGELEAKAKAKGFPYDSDILDKLARNAYEQGLFYSPKLLEELQEKSAKSAWMPKHHRSTWSSPAPYATPASGVGSDLFKNIFAERGRKRQEAAPPPAAAAAAAAAPLSPFDEYKAKVLGNIGADRYGFQQLLSDKYAKDIQDAYNKKVDPYKAFELSKKIQDENIKYYKMREMIEEGIQGASAPEKILLVHNILKDPNSAAFKDVENKLAAQATAKTPTQSISGVNPLSYAAYVERGNKPAFQRVGGETSIPSSAGDALLHIGSNIARREAAVAAGAAPQAPRSVPTSFFQPAPSYNQIPLPQEQPRKNFPLLGKEEQFLSHYFDAIRNQQQQMGDIGVMPLMLRELSQQFNQTPTRYVPVKPRKKPIEKVLKYFNPSQFHPYEFPE